LQAFANAGSTDGGMLHVVTANKLQEVLEQQTAPERCTFATTNNDWGNDWQGCILQPLLRR
jgi:hypothetical protein